MTNRNFERRNRIAKGDFQKHLEGKVKPKKVFEKQMKSGMHVSRSDTDQLKINLRVASGRAKKTISMPKLPWDK